MSGVSVAALPSRHARPTGHLLGAFGAWAFATGTSLGPIWANNSQNQRGGLVLAGILALWTAALSTLPRGRLLSLAALAAVAAVGLATVPTIGRTAVLAGLALGLAAFAVLADWQPLASWPVRPHGVSLVGLPSLAAAGLVWVDRQSVPLILVLLGSTLLLVEADHLRVAGVVAADRGLRRLLAAAGAAGGAVLRGAQKAQKPVAALGIGASVRASLGSAQAAIRLPKDRRDRWLAAALATGFALRAAWAVAYTRPPSNVGPSSVIGDYYSTMNLEAASAFASGHTPSIGGIPTAIWPPGTGGVLAPFAWISARTGWFELYQAGSLVNVVAGTLTIWFCAALAQRWFGLTARNPAAWLMALAPSPLFVTSVAILEPLAMALMTGSVLAATMVVQDREPGQRRRALFAVGVLIGYAVLTTDRAWILVLVPALVARVVDGRWNTALRTVGTVGAGALVLVLPWTVRNGVQLGWWSPNATSIPEGMCTVKYQYGTELTTADIRSPRFLPLVEDCFRGSPFDNPALGVTDVYPVGWEYGQPHEGAQAKRNMSRALRWFATHPAELLSSMPVRLRDVGASDETGGLDYATHFDRISLFSPSTRSLANDAADAWYSLVALLSIIGLVRSRRVRTALPLWLIPLVMLLQPLLGPYGFSRHFLMGYPFLAIMAAAVIGGGDSTGLPRLRPAPASGETGS